VKQDAKCSLPERLLLKPFPPAEMREPCHAPRQQPGNVWLGNTSAGCRQSRVSGSAETNG